MNVRDLVTELARQQIRVRLAGNELKVSAPKGKLPGHLLEALQAGRAELIAYLRETSPGARGDAFAPVEEQDHYPLSHAQKRLWLLDQRPADRTAYLMPGRYVLEGRVCQETLQRVLAHLVSRHESLRTEFVFAGGEPRQRVRRADAMPFRLRVVDLREDRDPAARLAEISRQEVTSPFDLEKAPLLRATLVHLAGQQHVFYLTMHHILSDAWSMNVLFGEALSLYAAFVAGRPAALPPLDVQYKDYAARERRRRPDHAPDAAREYWVGRFRDGIPETVLPVTGRQTDGPALAAFTRRMPPETVAQLRAMGQAKGASLFMTLLGLTKLLLARYTGNWDVVLGVPVAGREAPQLHDQIGFYVNTLLIRTHLDKHGSWQALLEAVKTNVLGAFDHQQYPADCLLEALDRAGNGKAAWPQVLVNYHKAPAARPAMPGFAVREDTPRNETPKTDVVIHFAETDGGVELDIEYNRARCAAWWIEQLADHLLTLAERVTRNPEQPLHAVDFLPAARREQLLNDYNATRTGYPADKTLPLLFEEQVERHGRKPALVAGGTTLTYDALNRQANRLAHYLRAQGAVGPDDPVAFMLERSAWVVVTILGIVKAGGAYLAIDPQTPPGRLGQLLADAAPKVFITSQALAARAGGPVPGHLSLESILPALAGYPDVNPAPVNRSADLAYVMYTSGSSGQPKGVLIEHRGVIRLVRNTDYVHLGERDQLLMVGALSFDAVTFELWGMLLNGGVLHLAPAADLLNPAFLAGYLTTRGITVMLLTTAWFIQLADNHPEVFRPLKTLLVGGEKLSPAHIRSVRAAFPALRLVNAYGPTENTTISTTHVITGAEAGEIPIGKPIANSKVYILDPDGNLVPPGAWGEIVVGGDGLARGYLNRPELTAERFVPSRYGAGERLYRTGDVGRWDAAGQIEYLGRQDNQLKIRGFRIEMGEIESVLAACPGVQQAVGVARRHAGGDPYLVAFYTGEATDEAALRDHLRRQLPEYMVPARLVRLERLPLTANGKVDYKDLAGREVGGTVGGGYCGPRNQTEAVLAGIWEKTLGIGPVGIHDNFFDAGGHSLKAAQVAACVYRELGVNLKLGDLFAHPTVAGVAAVVARQRAAAVEPIPPAPALPAYELSHAQLRLWLAGQHEAAKVAFNMPDVYEWRGALDRDVFARTLRVLVGRHESLRTTFVVSGGKPRQVIHPAEAVPLDVPFTNLAEGEGNRLGELLRQEIEKPFRLDALPLLRAAIFRVSEGRYVFALVFHHIIFDGWSRQVFMREFFRVYNALAGGAPLPLLPPGVQYKDYARWHNRFLAEPRGAAHRTYWQRVLSGPLPVLRLPLDKARPPVKTYRGGTYRFVIPGEQTAALEALCGRARASLYMGLLAAFKTVFYAYSGQDDLIVGVLAAGRIHPQLEEQVGFFVNSLPIRTRLDPGAPFLALLERVRESTLGAYAHEAYPFDLMLDDAGVRREPNRSPLFDVMIQLLYDEERTGQGEERTGQGEEPAGVAVEEYDLPFGQTRYDLEISVLKHQGRLVGQVKYNADLYQPGSVHLLAARLQVLLADILADPAQPVRHLARRIAGYFPGGDDPYRAQLAHLFWAERIARTAGAKPPAGLPPGGRGSRQRRTFTPDNQVWHAAAGLTPYARAVDEWTLLLLAASLVLNGYGHRHILWTTFGYQAGGEPDDCLRFFRFEADQQETMDDALAHLLGQYQESLLYGQYAYQDLRRHLLVNHQEEEALFEHGIGHARLHRPGEHLRERFKLFLLLAEEDGHYQLHAEFDDGCYPVQGVEQFFGHLARALAFLEPLLKEKTAPAPS